MSTCGRADLRTQALKDASDIEAVYNVDLETAEPRHVGMGDDSGEGELEWENMAGAGSRKEGKDYLQVRPFACVCVASSTP